MPAAWGVAKDPTVKLTARMQTSYVSRLMAGTAGRGMRGGRKRKETGRKGEG